jgi:hypothetical protein
MAVYLYNLLFSLTGSDLAIGRFTQYDSSILNPSISNQSCAWFTYQLAGTPGGLGDWFTPVNVALNPANWGDSQPDSGSLSLEPGDFLMMRVASLDASAGGYLGRFTGVFGRGTSQEETGSLDLQSPLLMSTPTAASIYPRAVIDVDGTAGSTWPAPVPDNSWVSWLGAVHTPANGAANDYTVNVGISLYAANNYYTFGRDPRLHVGGMVLHKRDRAA